LYSWPMGLRMINLYNSQEDLHLAPLTFNLSMDSIHFLTEVKNSGNMPV
jgi:hypothetical protein